MHEGQASEKHHGERFAVALSQRRRRIIQNLKAAIQAKRGKSCTAVALVD